MIQPRKSIDAKSMVGKEEAIDTTLVGCAIGDDDNNYEK